jgi:HAD superfamily hydrolase (TIGR01458 family)
MKALCLDLNGVLFEDRIPFAGATEVVAEARRIGLTLRFVTNTATRHDQAILSDLGSMGFDPAAGELFTAPLAARHYLRRHGLHPHCLVHPAIAPSFADLLGDPPDCVVLGDAREGFTYEALNRVFRLVRQGSPLIAIGMNRCFKEAGEWMLDAGAFVRAIEWAAGIEAIVMGKPSAAFFSELVASTGLQPHDCLMVGDDVEADVAGAMAAGLAGCLVKTGKFQPADLDRLPPGGVLVESIADLGDRLKAWTHDSG